MANAERGVDRRPPPPSLVIRRDSGARITRENMYVPYYNVSLHVRKRKGLVGRRHFRPAGGRASGRADGGRTSFHAMTRFRRSR